MESRAVTQSPVQVDPRGRSLAAPYGAEHTRRIGDVKPPRLKVARRYADETYVKVRSRKGSARAVIAALFALAGATQPASMAASSNVSVTFNVASQTTLVPTLCASGMPGRTDFGTVLPATKTVSSGDCRIEFGSTNDTARLQLTQSDAEGQALWGGEASGAPEATFDGGDGWRVHSRVAGSEERYFDATLQNDHDMVAVGRQFVAGDEEVSVSRYRSDGTIDATFGTAGNTQLNLVGNDYATGVAIAPDGSVMIAGERYSNSMFVAKLDANGNVVTSWGTGGAVQHDLYPGGEEEPLDFAVLADGSMIVAGWINKPNAEAYVAKLQPNGALDPAFGVGGVREFDVQGSRDLAWGLAIQSDGKILVTGPARNVGNGEDDVFVARLTTTGALDTATFGGGDGIYTYDSGPGTETDFGSSLAVLADGRILVSGTAAGGGNDLLVLRLLANGTLDPTFGTAGVVIRHDGASDEQGTDLDVLPDGGIAVIGTRASVNGAIQSWRLKANGAPDTTFSGDGYAEFPITGFANVDMRAQVIGPDGSVMFAGAASGDNLDYLVGRLDSTTIPDYAAGRWTSSSPLFGACLRDATNATPTWTEDGNLTCTAVDTDPWNAIARTSADPTAEVARAANSVDDAIVDLRFGVNVASSQRPGALVAPITFQVIAPA